MPSGGIDIDFDVDGEGAASIWEEPGEPTFTDGLWQGTCFEAFLAAEDHPGYIELNFTPAGLWAAYGFDDYRTGMRRLPEADLQPSAFRWSRAISIRTSAHLSVLPSCSAWRANFTAIVRAEDGTKSYWALAHPPEGPPDFHNPACFTATLPPPPAP